MIVHGNIEPYLAYKKLHRSGKLLRSIKRKVKTGSRASITLYSNVSYARLQAEGGTSPVEFVPKNKITGAYAVKVGGKIYPRPFMTPSKQVLQAPSKLVEKKIKSIYR